MLMESGKQRFGLVFFLFFFFCKVEECMLRPVTGIGESKAVYGTREKELW